MNINVFTDGGCSINPGPGAWAYIIDANGKKRRSSGGVPDTTNNRMELTGVIEALQYILTHKEWQKGHINVYTDSQYVKKGITEWIIRWERNGWLTSNRKPVKNRDLWEKLKLLTESLSIKWNWIKGHEGEELNEECDHMVRAEIENIKRKFESNS